jgi:hypothetical protein
MSLILPPRLEGRAAEEAAMMVEIPIYEAEQLDSLRPTWLPIDPSTYRPPPKRSRGAKLASAAKIAVLLFAVWGLAFASVVGPHFAHEYVAKRAAAASNANATTAVSPENHVDSSPPKSPAAPTTSPDAMTLTVDVMNLPVSKDFRNQKAKPRSRS